MDPMDPQDVVQEDLTLRTRSGYPVADAVRSFKVSLEQTGASATGKSLHYTADLITSGCFHLWQKILWEYCIDHVGIASARIFWFLQRRFNDLEAAWAKIPPEQFYRTVEYQKTFAEIILIIRSQPRRPALKMPRIPPESHNEQWVKNATSQAPSSAVVGRVFRASNDLLILRRVGDEFVKACVEGATERAFWWMKWCYEEESRVRRDTGGCLSNLDRGPAQWTGKQRSHVGFYLAALLAEVYKELAPKHGLRMNEEFQSILQLYSYPNKKLTAKRRQDLLCLAIQIVCEVPRWKVPAAAALVKDPVALERAMSHAESFFREVLTYDAPMGDVEKEAKKGASKSIAAGGHTGKQLSQKQLKQMSVEEHLNARDAMIEGWLNGRM
jgi:hypothetical protein